VILLAAIAGTAWKWPQLTASARRQKVSEVNAYLHVVLLVGDCVKLCACEFASDDSWA